MKSKIILVTGASDGIGKETARTLAAQGHTILLHGRNREKTRAAYEEIKKESGNQNIEMFTADFLSLAEVKRFAEDIRSKYERLDVLINNAGAQFSDVRETTSEGHEKTMTINLFAPFLLTQLLLDLLAKSDSARVLTVSSASHSMGGKPALDDIELKRSYSMAKAYAWSKLYVIWMMRHFVKEAKRRGFHHISFNTVHPGSAATSLGRESTKQLKFRIIYFLWKPMMNSLAAGARSSVQGAVSPGLEGVTGKYFGPKGEEKPAEKYYSAENEQTVWDHCVQVTRPFMV
ncbi:MAG: SDR family NAD(P)-dependent oxidoreductase [Bacteroidia bacterium]|nr:SDR family NAD(P)-dependent oxidoreductase [Bacteroidia bacterium]